MKITVTDELTEVPARPGRKQLLVKNTGEKTAYLSWEDNVVAEDTGYQGYPLAPDADFNGAGRDIDISGPLYCICAAGEQTTLNYIDKA